jgi:hypothetical protein
VGKGGEYLHLPAEVGTLVVPDEPVPCPMLTSCLASYIDGVFVMSQFSTAVSAVSARTSPPHSWKVQVMKFVRNVLDEHRQAFRVPEVSNGQSAALRLGTKHPCAQAAILSLPRSQC